MRNIYKVLFLFLLCVNTAYAESRVYKIGMTPWIAFSPLNVADQLGLWKEKGLNVQVVNFENNQELNAALLNKKIDIACDMIGNWVGLFMTGQPITIIAEGDWSHGGDQIIVKKDLDTNNLKGKQVGLYLNQPSVLYFLNKYLTENKTTLADMKMASFAAEDPAAIADNFISNRLSIIVNYDPEASRAEKEGNGKVVATSATYPGVIPEGFVTRTDVLNAFPEADLVNIFRAYIKAVQWCKKPENWAQYQQILNSKTYASEKPYPEQELKDMLDGVRIHDVAELTTSNNSNDGSLYKYLTDLKQFLKNNNLLTADFDPKTIANTKALMSALQEVK